MLLNMKRIMMKRTLGVLVPALFLFLSCAKPAEEVVVTLSPSQVSMMEGTTTELQVKVTPGSASDYTLRWESSSPSIASVANGVVTAHTAGQAVITVSTQDKQAQCTVTVTEKPQLLTRSVASSGKVTNGVKLTYSGTQFTRIYVLLPRPQTNEYQTISNWEASGCTEGQCPDGVNAYIWKDVNASSIPASGEYLISETFDAEVYRVVVDVTQLTDIPAYDPQSEECQKYLGKEANGLIDPTHSKIVSTANTLWDQSGGDIISYARKCFQWTYANMTYGNMNTGLHTIANLMKTMTGDCGNYSSVFISLLRAKGIPARHIVMVHGKLDEYHVRAEFFVPGFGWVPADPTWGGDNFGVFSGDYIVMTRGINTIVRNADGNNFQADLLQTFFYWYWCQTEGTSSFRHVCTGLK